MSVELEYNGDRYMVDGYQWYRRLKPTEILPVGYQFLEGRNWKPGNFPNTIAGLDMYRVPCVDPRPPFKVGDRVRVARKDDGWGGWNTPMGRYIDGMFEVKSIHMDGSCKVGDWFFPPWCLDLIETAKSTVGQTIIERLTKHVEKTEQETAKVMKFSQWQLRPAKEPKTLADVESSRERPVLCWKDNTSLQLMWVGSGGRAAYTIKNGVTFDAGFPGYELYQPSTPAYTLETLPDYRVVICDGLLYFRIGEQWFDSYVNEPDGFDPAELGPDIDFTLTPYEAYLAEVDLTGGAK